jgi:hypothetical protein
MIVGVNGVDVSGMDTYGALFLGFAVGAVTVNT